MYQILEKYKKTLFVCIILALIISTQLTTSIVSTQFSNDTSFINNAKLLYTISFISITISSLLNFIYIKIILAFFKKQKSNLVIIFYAFGVMLLFLVLEPLEIHVITKTLIKIFVFNLLFQDKEVKRDLFIVSLIMASIDMLMTLLLIWG